MSPLLVALLLCPAPASTLSPGPDPAAETAQDGRGTLEEMLAKARARRDALYARLREEVQLVLKRIEAEPLPATRTRRGLLTAEVVALGPECTTLLLPALDPGPAPEDATRFRAGIVAAGLERLNTAAITSGLLRMFATGSDTGKRNAIRVLQLSPEPERVGPALLEMFDGVEAPLKQSVLRALIELPGNDQELLKRVLEGDDEKLIGMALGALTATKSEAALTEVRAILADPAQAQGHALALLTYFQAVPGAVGEGEMLAFLALADRGKLPTDTRIALIDAMSAFDPSGSNAIKKALEPIVAANNRKVAEAGLVLLAVMGDRGAKRELLSSYDNFVEMNARWAPAYARRAEILRRIRELDDAIKDYKRALDLGREDPAAQADTYIGLARCYALKGKLRDASEYLGSAPINMQQLRALAEDPDFKELREHPRHGSVFPDDA